MQIQHADINHVMLDWRETIASTIARHENEILLSDFGTLQKELDDDPIDTCIRRRRIGVAAITTSMVMIVSLDHV